MIYQSLKSPTDLAEEAYLSDSTHGVHRIDSIQYSEYSISFNWEARTDQLYGFSSPNTRYLSGERLNKISIKHNNNDIQWYSINYQMVNSQNYIKSINLHSPSSVRKVSEFDYHFYSENSFTYGYNNISDDIYLSDGGLDMGTRFSDINGDGFVDIIQSFLPGGYYNGQPQRRVLLNNKYGSYVYDHSFSSSIPDMYFASNDGDMGTRIQDINGDGLPDLVQIYLPTSGHYNGIPQKRVYLNNGHSFENDPGYSNSLSDTYFTDNIRDMGTRLADINGDGLVDIIQLYISNLHYGGAPRKVVYLNNGSGFDYNSNYSSSLVDTYFSGHDKNLGTKLADINRDGLVDIIQLYLPNGGLYGGIPKKRIYLNDGVRFNPSHSYTNSLDDTYFNDHENDMGTRLNDINGDGYIDIIQLYLSNGGYYGGHPKKRVYINNGNAFEYSDGFSNSLTDTYFSDHTHDMGTRMADINADGLVDIIQLYLPTNGYYNNIPQRRIFLNSGTDFIYSNSLSSKLSDFYFSNSERSMGTEIQDMNGDGAMDLIQLYLPRNGLYGGTPQRRISLSVPESGLLTEISAPIGGKIHIYYKPLTSGIVYSKGDAATYPEIDVQGGMKVVYSATVHDGNTELSKQYYKYGGLKYHMKGMGSLGFSSISTSFSKTGKFVESMFSQNWQDRTTGILLSKRELIHNIELSKTVNDIGAHTLNNAHFFPHIKRSTTVQRDYDSSFMGITTREFKYSNQYDYPYKYQLIEDKTCITNTDTLVNGTIPCAYMSGKVKEDTKLLEYQYAYAHVPPLLNKEVLFASNHDGNPDLFRIKSYEYYNNSTKLKAEIIEPDRPEMKLRTTFTYTTQGQLSTTRVWGGSGTSSITTRTSNNIYETSGLYRLIEKQNALGHKETFTYDTTFPWSVKTVTSPNGLTVTNHYNSFGERYKVVRPDNTSSETTKEWCSSNPVCSGVPNALFYSKVSSTGKADGYTFFDSLGREIRSQFLGQYNASTNKNIIKDTLYDSLGRISSVSDSYFSGDTAKYTSTTYDALSRPKIVTSPDGSELEYFYNGLTHSTTFRPIDGAGGDQTKTIVKNALGQNTKTIDNDGNELLFNYDAFGNLVRTTDPDGNTVEIEYDIRGRKVTMDDPDQGLWTYTYYADDSLRSQTDAKNQTTSMLYDKLGRMTSRTEAEGTSQWVYDTCAKGIGKLCSVTNNNGYTKTYSYNTLGLPENTTTNISGQGAMVQAYAYDSNSRLTTVTYPGGFRTRNYYNTLGLVSKVTNDVNGSTLWEPTEYNARGQVQTFNQGSITTNRIYDENTGSLKQQIAYQGVNALSEQNYYWLANGNLDYKTDKWRNQSSDEVSEYYDYDSLNRLDSYQTLVGSAQHSLITVDYNEIGNITYKSDVGTYSYNQNRPHAVSNITSKGSYIYDANGNMTSGAGRTIQYTSFNKPKYISSNGAISQISYGPNRSRYKRVDSGTSSSTIYYAGAYEKEIRGGTTLERVTVGGHAILEKVNGAYSTTFTIRDHLGSLVASIKDTGDASRLNYDPWGKRRNLGLGSTEMVDISLTSLMSYVAQRGFTGHEHLSNVGLIHMNGRVYDPQIGRFLSADPLIQAPNDTQSYNRYAYVRNNPLKYTDPSGYSWWSKNVTRKWRKFRKNVSKAWRDNYKTIIAVGLAAWGGWAVYGAMYNSAMAAGISAGGGLASSTVAVGSIHASATIGAGMVGGAASGAIMGASLTAMNGGNLRDVINAGAKGAVTGAVSGAAFGAIGAYYGNSWSVGRVAWNGAAGGVSSKVSGGNFNDGFKLAGLAAFARYGYNKLVKYDATWESGEQAIDKRFDQMPNEGRNNIGMQGNGVGDPNNWFDLREGGAISNVANKIPGLNSVAGLHDVFQVKLGVGWEREVLNVPGMIVAAPISYAALLSDPTLLTTAAHYENTEGYRL